MDQGGLRGVFLEGTVGADAFLLEIPAAAIVRAAKVLDLPFDATAEPGSTELEKHLKGFLCAEAFRASTAAAGGDTWDWRAEGYRWDALESFWRCTYSWSRLEPLLQNETATEAPDPVAEATAVAG